MFDPHYKRGSEDTLHQLIKHCPDDPEPYQELGDIYFRRGDLKVAWRWYMEALKVDPNDPFTCMFFGTFLNFCKDKKSALKLFLHAKKNSPNLSVVHWCLGDHYRSMKRFDDAQRSYERAVKVDPEDEQAKAKLAEWRTFIANLRSDIDANEET